ncbi:DnaJ domain-containing protein [Aspergillus karnatakaensis]|uniref:DnaJ domain protein n=1 Tax=Aspergillus karnatakaensis TaxID=1810916 RepID=UPI003CCDDF95
MTQASDKRPTPQLRKCTSTPSLHKLPFRATNSSPSHTEYINGGMPCLRHLKIPIAQFHLDNPHCHRAIPILPRDHYSTSSIRNYRQISIFCYGHTHKSFFSTSRSHSLASAREPTYYEVLDVPITATPAEIKKQFYALSLRHHPDRNRDDPSASSRFAKISSAYQTLGNSTKRATYDRDHGIHAFTSSSTHSTANPGQHPMGSYSSYSSHGSGGASYFGSRPASGLSKRRGTFRGPPPSFYAHGGYGNRKGSRDGFAGAGAGFAGGAGAGAAGGAGSRSAKDDDPTSFIDRNPVSHFNARGHYRTQTAEDARRQDRKSRETRVDINEQFIGNRGDFIFRFIVVSGMLAGVVALSGFASKNSGKGKSSSRLGVEGH